MAQRGSTPAGSEAAVVPSSNSAQLASADLPGSAEHAAVAAAQADDQAQGQLTRLSTAANLEKIEAQEDEQQTAQTGVKEEMGVHGTSAHAAPADLAQVYTQCLKLCLVKGMVAIAEDLCNMRQKFNQYVLYASTLHLAQHHFNCSLCKFRTQW